jgi:hypothetical protein
MTCALFQRVTDSRVEEMENRTTNLTRKETTMKLIPAIFFQKQLNGVKEEVQTPERLDLFESELREVVGGAILSASRLGGTRYYSTTYSYSAGWLDVLQADDCE